MQLSPKTFCLVGGDTEPTHFIFKLLNVQDSSTGVCPKFCVSVPL